MVLLLLRVDKQGFSFFVLASILLGGILF